VVAAGGDELKAWRLDANRAVTRRYDFPRHEAAMQSIVLAEQSSRIATVGWEGAVRVWDLAAENPETPLAAIPGSESLDFLTSPEVELSRDGRWLLIATPEIVTDGPLAKTLRLFDLARANPNDNPIELADYDDGMQEARFDPGGRWVVAHSSEKVWMWPLFEMSGTAPRREFWSGEMPIRDITFDPRRRWMLVTRYSGTSQLVDLTVDAPAKNRRDLGLRGEVVRFSSDGRWLACGYDAALHVWSLADPESPPLEIPCLGVPVERLRFTHDSQWLACEWTDGAIRRYPLTAEDPIAGAVAVKQWSDVPVLVRPPRWMVADGDVPRLIERGSDAALDEIVLRGHQMIPGGYVRGVGPFFNMELSGDIVTIAFDEQAEHVLTVGADDTVRLWDLTSVNPSRSARVLQSGDSRGLAALSPDGAWAATGGPGKNDVQLWKLKEGAEPTPIVLAAHEQEVTQLLFTPDSRFLVTADRGGVIRLRRLADSPAEESLVLVEGGGEIRCLVVDSRGWRLAAGDASGVVTVIDLVADGTVSRIAQFKAHEDAVNSVLLDPDGGRRLWTGAADGTAAMWTIDETGAATRQATFPHDRAIRSMAVAPGGNWLATRGYGGTVRLWDLTRKDLGVDPVELSGSAAVFDPTGRWLACDQQLWDLAKAQPFRAPVVLHGGNHTITCLAGDRHGRFLAAGDNEGLLRLWPFGMSHLLDYARRAGGERVEWRE